MGWAGGGRRKRRGATALAGLAVSVALLALAGCDGLGGSAATIHMDEVEDAIEATGLRIAYRKSPRVDGYDTLAGRASNRRGGIVDFAVVIDRNGEYEGHGESAVGGSPQPPVVRRAAGPAATTTLGNAYWSIEPQTPYRMARVRYAGVMPVATRGADDMAFRLRRAIQDLFGEPYRSFP